MSKNKLLYKNMSIEELVILSQKEDFQALEELIRRIQSDIYATFCYLLKNHDTISDLTQEALLKISKNISSLKKVECFKSWSNQIITNTYYDFIKKKKSIPDMIPLDYDCEDSNFSLKIEIPDKKNKPIEQCISTECENFIKNAILELPEIFKIVIILREFKGLSYEEIAKNTKTSIGTVKSRIARARIKLQDALKHYI